MVNLYEEIKAGRKTSEWRDASEYWSRRLCREPVTTFHPPPYAFFETSDYTEWLEVDTAWFTVGFPKNNLPRLEAEITGLILHYNSDKFEIKIANVKERQT